MEFKGTKGEWKYFHASENRMNNMDQEFLSHQYEKVYKHLDDAHTGILAVQRINS